MRKKKQNRNFSLIDGVLKIGGELVQLPNLRLLKCIGRGANGIVFAAHDEQLERDVAVKIWYQLVSDRRSRALSEAKKLASLAHPMVVMVYNFDVVLQHPVAIMELIIGGTLQDWLQQSPSIPERSILWGMFSKGMQHIYAQGTLHGDPHTKNIFVFEDQAGTYDAFVDVPYHRQPSKRFALKISDAGTSKIWKSQKKLIDRECHILIETVTRMFGDPSIESLMKLDKTLHPRIVLCILDQYVQLITVLDDIKTIRDLDHLEDTLYELTTVLSNAPFFRLQQVVEAIVVRGIGENDAYSVVRRACGIRGLSSVESSLSQSTTVEEFERLEKHYFDTQKEFICRFPRTKEPNVRIFSD